MKCMKRPIGDYSIAYAKLNNWRKITFNGVILMSNFFFVKIRNFLQVGIVNEAPDPKNRRARFVNRFVCHPP